MANYGIDYSFGRSNVNHETGIHYGVISQGSMNPDCWDDIEPDYGDPACPECGGAVVDSSDPSVAGKDWDESGCGEYACPECEHFWDSGHCYGDEPIGHNYDKEGYKITSCLDTDLMVLESPYFTRATFCSPCVPGAGNLDTPCADGPRTYCLGHDWFEGGKAPYPVYRVSDGSEVTGVES